MSNKLTKKEKGFVNDYVETGNGVQSILKNYDVEAYHTAGQMAHENLNKPKIIKAIQEALPDDLLANKHLELFDQKRIEYFMFPKTMSDEEITDHVTSVGIKVITVRPTEKGKMAFYSLTDAQAVTKALDMSYKLKGSYAAEKTTSLNVNIEARNVANPEIEAIHKRFIEELKTRLSHE